MTAELGYDTTNLRALQDELRHLNAAAFAEGLLGDVPKPRTEAADAAPPEPSKASRRRGKAAARRLLDLAGRVEDDDSPDVPGTRFTEAGVVRLLAHLRRRRGRGGAWPRFLARIGRSLARPVSFGQHVVAGVALARLQIVCRQLLEIERHGLAHLTARRAVRRGRVAEASALMLGATTPPPLGQGKPS